MILMMTLSLTACGKQQVEADAKALTTDQAKQASCNSTNGVYLNLLDPYSRDCMVIGRVCVQKTNEGYNINNQAMTPGTCQYEVARDIYENVKN